jgi:Flp pilus assembly protein TadG
MPWTEIGIGAIFLAVLFAAVTYARRLGGERAHRQTAEEKSEALSEQAKRRSQPLATNTERQAAARAQLNRHRVSDGGASTD